MSRSNSEYEIDKGKHNVKLLTKIVHDTSSAEPNKISSIMTPNVQNKFTRESSDIEEDCKIVHISSPSRNQQGYVRYKEFDSYYTSNIAPTLKKSTLVFNSNDPYSVRNDFDNHSRHERSSRSNSHLGPLLPGPSIAPNTSKQSTKFEALREILLGDGLGGTASHGSGLNSAASSSSPVQRLLPLEYVKTSHTGHKSSTHKQKSSEVTEMMPILRSVLREDTPTTIASVLGPNQNIGQPPAKIHKPTPIHGLKYQPPPGDTTNYHSERRSSALVGFHPNANNVKRNLKSTSEKIKYCSLCENHGQLFNKSGHKCERLQCSCLPCRLTRKLHIIIKHQQGFWRFQKKDLANHEKFLRYKNSKSQLCDKCRNHNEFHETASCTVHLCPRERCNCDKCSLSDQRRLVTKYLKIVHTSKLSKAEMKSMETEISNNTSHLYDPNPAEEDFELEELEELEEIKTNNVASRDMGTMAQEANAVKMGDEDLAFFPPPIKTSLIGDDKSQDDIRNFLYPRSHNDSQQPQVPISPTLVAPSQELRPLHASIQSRELLTARELRASRKSNLPRIVKPTGAVLMPSHGSRPTHVLMPKHLPRPSHVIIRTNDLKPSHTSNPIYMTIPTTVQGSTSMPSTSFAYNERPNSTNTIQHNSTHFNNLRNPKSQLIQEYTPLRTEFRNISQVAMPNVQQQRHNDANYPPPNEDLEKRIDPRYHMKNISSERYRGSDYPPTSAWQELRRDSNQHFSDASSETTSNAEEHSPGAYFQKQLRNLAGNPPQNENPSVIVADEVFEEGSQFDYNFDYKKTNRQNQPLEPNIFNGRKGEEEGRNSILSTTVSPMSIEVSSPPLQSQKNIDLKQLSPIQETSIIVPPPSDDVEMETAQNSSKKRIQHCTFCQNHGLTVSKNSHLCQFSSCECVLCRLTGLARLVMRHQQAVWRYLNRELAKTEGAATRQSMRQVCDKCRNHSTFFKKRHHRNCSREKCPCALCQLTDKRRFVMMHLQRIRRAKITCKLYNVDDDMEDESDVCKDMAVEEENTPSQNTDMTSLDNVIDRVTEAINNLPLRVRNMAASEDLNSLRASTQKVPSSEPGSEASSEGRSFTKLDSNDDHPTKFREILEKSSTSPLPHQSQFNTLTSRLNSISEPLFNNAVDSDSNASSANHVLDSPMASDHSVDDESSDSLHIVVDAEDKEPTEGGEAHEVDPFPTRCANGLPHWA